MCHESLHVTDDPIDQMVSRHVIDEFSTNVADLLEAEQKAAGSSKGEP
jgi:hypothetical protein